MDKPVLLQVLWADGDKEAEIVVIANLEFRESHGEFETFGFLSQTPPSNR
jgi:hypothetical protein